MDSEKGKLHLIDSLATDIRCSSEGQQFNKRIDRYSTAKNFAVGNYKYIRDNVAQSNKVRKVSAALRDCGSYLVFNHYFTTGEIKLTKASLCKKHLLCPLCAIRRGSKTLGAYMSKFTDIMASNSSLKAYMVTLTVKDGDDLQERVSHLRNSWVKYTKNRKRPSCDFETKKIDSLVYSIEVKRGKNSNLWHPHMHSVWLSEDIPNQDKLSKEWHSITGDSFIVDVREITPDDPIKGFLEVFKYAVKFSSQAPEDTWHCFKKLSGVRLLNPMGGFRGTKEEEPLDEEEDLPSIELFFKWFGKKYMFVNKETMNKELDSENLKTNKSYFENDVRESKTIQEIEDLARIKNANKWDISRQIKHEFSDKNKSLQKKQI
jgi:hypothetical protein